MPFAIPAFELNAGQHVFQCGNKVYETNISLCAKRNTGEPGFNFETDYKFWQCMYGIKEKSRFDYYADYSAMCCYDLAGEIGHNLCERYPDYMVITYPNKVRPQLTEMINRELVRRCNISKTSKKSEVSTEGKANKYACELIKKRAEVEEEKKRQKIESTFKNIENSAKADQERDISIRQKTVEGKLFEEGMCGEQRKVLIKALARYYQMRGLEICGADFDDKCDNFTLSDLRNHIEFIQKLWKEDSTGYLTKGQINKLLHENKSRNTYLDAIKTCEAEKQNKIDDLFAEIEKDAAKECESKLSSSKKKQIQIALTEEVGYSGPIDGNLDESRVAIKAWQKKTNTVETGYVGCEQDKKLILDNMESIMAYADKQIEASKKAAEELEAARACEAQLEESQKKQLQVALAPEGYDHATINGDLDGSREVIKSWQRSNGHNETGYLKCEHIKSVIAENIDKVMEYATGEIEVAQKNAEEEARKAEEEINRLAEEKALSCEVPGKYAEFQPYIEAEVTGKTVYEFVETVQGYLDRRQLRKLQRTLKDHPRRSYYRSTIDGLWGKGTRSGILDWIEDENPKYQPGYIITKADASCLIRDIAIAVEKSEQAQRAAEQAAEAAKKEKAKAQSQQENTNTNTNPNNSTNVLGNVNSVIGTIKQIQSIGGIIGGSGHGHDDHPEEDPDTALICDENGVCLPQN